MRIRTLIGPMFSSVTFVLLAQLTPQNSSVMSEPFAQVIQLATGLIVVRTAARVGLPRWLPEDLDGQRP